MVDDFHNIHSLHTPSKLVHTNIVHMAFCLADIHPTIHAVPWPECSLNSSWPHIYKQSAAKREAAVLSANFWYHSWYQVFSTKLQLRWCRTWLATWSEHLLWLINLHKNRWPLLLGWPAFIVSMKHAFFNQILAAQSVWSYWKKSEKISRNQQQRAFKVQGHGTL